MLWITSAKSKCTNPRNVIVGTVYDLWEPVSSHAIDMASDEIFWEW